MRPGVTLLVLTSLATAAFAAPLRPIPRFVSTRSNEANLRVGPGREYPPAWVFVRANIPVEVTAEFDNWRRIRDFDGTEGWFHKSMLKSERFGIIQPKEVLLLSSNSQDSTPVVRIEQGVAVKIQKCRGSWCKVKVKSHEGWLKRDTIWGVYEGEKI